LTCWRQNDRQGADIRVLHSNAVGEFIVLVADSTKLAAAASTAAAAKQCLSAAEGPVELEYSYTASPGVSAAVCISCQARPESASPVAGQPAVVAVHDDPAAAAASHAAASCLIDGASAAANELIKPSAGDLTASETIAAALDSALVLASAGPTANQLASNLNPGSIVGNGTVAADSQASTNDGYKIGRRLIKTRLILAFCERQARTQS